MAKISELMQDYASRMKEKFSPKNLAKAFTKKEDGDEPTDFAEKVFNRKKPSRVKPGRTLGTIHHALYTTISSGTRTRLRNNESVANVAAKTYNLLLKSFEEKKIRLEISKDFERDLHNKDKIRHENLIKSIKEAKSKQDEVKIDKKKIVDKEKKPPTKTTKKIAEQKTPPKTTKAPSSKTEKVIETKTTKVPSSKTEKVIETKTTKVPSSKPGLSTAQKVGIGVGIGAAAIATTAIGGAESGGNYNVTFGDKVDKKSGKIKNPRFKTTQDVFGKDLTDMTLSEVKEFGRIRSENGQGAGAVGKYQFMPSTLFGTKKGVGLVQQLGLDMNTKFTPEVQDKLQELLHAQDVKTLKRLGVPITPGYEYMAHYIGAGGAAAVYKSIQMGEDKTVAQVMADHNFSVGNNPELNKIRASEFEGILQGRLEKRGGMSPHSSADDIPQLGNKINSISKQNKDLKQGKRATIIIDSSTNTTTIGSTNKVPQVLTTTTNTDLPLHQR
jgi:muramidase (phage lysozyme)